MVLRSLTITLLLLVLLTLPFRTMAAVTISEIMYDAEGSDTDREWIELYNGGSEAVGLMGFKVNDGSNHVLNEPPKNGGQGTLTIAPGGYAVLAGNAAVFLSEYLTSVAVIDTVLGLKNINGTISLADAEGNAVDTVAYEKEMGAADDGNSLQRNGANWIAALPTPGAGNALVATSPPTETKPEPKAALGVNKPATPAPSSTKTAVSSGPEVFSATFKAPPVVIAGDTVRFPATVSGPGASAVGDADMLWNFGDGTTGTGSEAEHTYGRPGTYVVVLVVTGSGEDAQARATIVAEPSPISITQVEPGGEGFIILKNGSDREADLSGWRLAADTVTFRLPMGTILLPDTDVVFSAHATGLAVADVSTVALLFPTGKMAARLSERDQAVKTTPPSSEVVSTPRPAKAPKGATVVDRTPIASPVSSDTDAPTLVQSDSPVENLAVVDRAAAAASRSGHLTPWFASLAALIIVGVAAGLALRRPATPQPVKEEVDTYTIIDDEDDE